MIDHFTIHEVFHDQLHECEEGDEFTLWTRPEAPLIYAYRDGTIGGQGKVVAISKLDNPKLVEMMDAGWLVDLTLLQKGERLRFQLTAEPPDPPEVAAKKAAAYEASLRDEVRALLTRPYRPVKRELSVQVRSREGRKFRVGESMSLPLRTLDQRLEKHAYDVRFVGESGTVGWVIGNTELRQRILRAQFSGYEISAVVTAVWAEPAYCGSDAPFSREEQCTATVFFNEKT
ncbi:hypothetical protein [Telluria beijingensis]|uniref:hypothetical protein n=1 Tax=Telluria beijingensis TaxID=3068633 RepID=UPI0027952F3D|nr:hypothetical protein [Massilia sp. REN29]